MSSLDSTAPGDVGGACDDGRLPPARRKIIALLMVDAFPWSPPPVATPSASAARRLCVTARRSRIRLLVLRAASSAHTTV
eukprot:3600796-Prymnesium_polylepis.1